MKVFKLKTVLTISIIFGMSICKTQENCKDNISSKELNDCDTLYYFIDSIDYKIIEWIEWNNLWQTWKNCTQITDPDQYGWCISHKFEFCNCVLLLSNINDFKLNQTCALNTLLSKSCTTSSTNEDIDSETSTINTNQNIETTSVPYVYLNQSDVTTTESSQSIIIRQKVVHVQMFSAVIISMLVLGCLSFSLIVLSITVCILRGKLVCCECLPCFKPYIRINENEDVIDLGNIRKRSVSQIEGIGGIGTTGQGVTGHIGHTNYIGRTGHSPIVPIGRAGHMTHMPPMQLTVGHDVGHIVGNNGCNGNIAAFGGHGHIGYGVGHGIGHGIGHGGFPGRSHAGTISPMHRIQESIGSESGLSMITQVDHDEIADK